MTDPWDRDREAEPPPAVIYARVSSADQEKEGYSIPAQLRLLREYAEQRGIKVVREFTDAETAKRAGRRGFTEMLALVESDPEVKAVLVEKTDRLYRNFRDYVTVDDLDVEIHLVKEGEVMTRDSRSHQKLMHGIKVLIAKNFIDNLSEETRKGMAEKVAAGGFPHKAPVGYRNNPITRSISVDPSSAPYVRRLFELYSTGDYSLDDIRRRCIEDGLLVPSKSGRMPHKSRVEQLLKNTFYIGRMRWCGKDHAGDHEPIVPLDLFEKVQAVLRSGTRRRGKYRVHQYAFGALMTCGACGSSVTGFFVKRRYVYYRCSRLGHGCCEPYYHEDDLAPQFEQLVATIRISEEVMPWLESALDFVGARDGRHRLRIEDRLTQELSKVERRLKAAYIDKVEGRIDEAMWTQLSSEWQSERDRLAGLVGSGRVPDRNELTRRTPSALDPWLPYSRQASPVQRQRLLASVLDACSLAHGGRLTFKFRPPFGTLVQLATLGARHERDSAQSGPEGP